MKEYIDKSAVEKILRNLWKTDSENNAEHRICYNKALQEVQCELDALEVKDADLEKEFCSFLDKVGAPVFWCNDEEQIEWMFNIARHFYELGLNAKKKNK